MAYNDMQVMIYRILRYIDICLKSGKTPTKEDILRDCQLYKLSESYADALLEEVSDDGYVKGISTVSTKDGGVVIVHDNVRIRLTGRNYQTEVENK